jgi:hypothetical protein
MTWRDLFERGAEYDVTLESVGAALREHRDDR